jgi:uncharacterized protein with PQ loop repeat
MVGPVVMDLTWVIGFVASIAITLSFFPQFKRMWEVRHRPIEEFHPLWFLLNMFGSCLFVTYGFLINQIGLIILNSVGLIMLFLMYGIYKGVWVKDG